MLLNARSDSQLDQNSSILAANEAGPASEAERPGLPSGLRASDKFGMYGHPKKAATGNHSSQGKYKAAGRSLGRVGTQVKQGVLQGRTGSGAGSLRNHPLGGQKHSITGLSVASYQSTGQPQTKVAAAKASLPTLGYQQSQLLSRTEELDEEPRSINI